MKKAFPALFASSLLTAVGLQLASSNFSPVNAASISFLASPFDGDKAEVKITLDDTIEFGKVQFKVDVVPNPFIADLRGVFFNIANNSLLKDLMITGSDITEIVQRPGDVLATSTSSIMPEGRFDIGVQIGTPGRLADDVRSTIFTISHPDIGLDIGQFTTETEKSTQGGPKELLFAVEVTSVGTVNGPRSGRSRLGAGVGDRIDDKVTVPEPSAIVGLAVLGLGGLLLNRRRVRPT